MTQCWLLISYRRFERFAVSIFSVIPKKKKSKFLRPSLELESPNNSEISSSTNQHEVISNKTVIIPQTNREANPRQSLVCLSKLCSAICSCRAWVYNHSREKCFTSQHDVSTASLAAHYRDCGTIRDWKGNTNILLPLQHEILSCINTQISLQKRNTQHTQYRQRNIAYRLWYLVATNTTLQAGFKSFHYRADYCPLWWDTVRSGRNYGVRENSSLYRQRRQNSALNVGLHVPLKYR